ncbi:MAG TPA: phosphatase PAP2 family protein [Candidatus Eisenbacteria bacterium]|nr:phosphatase PAP2 family protein [Candidatus Eisenbacteria bacterium]
MKNYAFIDFATQGYILLTGLLILIFPGAGVPYRLLLLTAHVLGMVLIHLLIGFNAARNGGKPIQFLRHFYPILLYTAFYRETAALNHLFISGYLDPLFVRLEERLFGLQPSLAFMDWLPFLPVSEILYASYFSYYLMIGGVGVALFLRNRAQFFHYLSVVSFVFYVCYLIYIFLPVMGPRIFYYENISDFLPPELQPPMPVMFPTTVQSGPFYQIMVIIYRYFEAPGAAFPSSHVAVAITTLYFSILYLRRIRQVHLVAVLLLCLSTVYCRYHYVVDVFAGVLTALVLVPLGNKLYFKFKQLSPIHENPAANAPG